MKKFLFTIPAVLLLSCAANNGNNIINASLPNAGEDILSWLDIFPDTEMIRLTGEQLPILSPWSELIVSNNTYYVIDPRHTHQIHRFNQNGNYLNSIGSQGRGPNEYLHLTDVMVDDNGNITIHSVGESSLLTYSPEGLFLERKELSYSPERFASLNGFNYHYMGTAGAGMDYRLYVTDKSGETIGALLPSPTAPSTPSTRTFSQYGSTLNLCPSEGNDIYQLKDGKMEIKYSFNFGIYTIPDEYYKCSDYRELLDFFAKGMALKHAFYENGHCAILLIIIDTLKELRTIYGILDKKKNTWRWFNGDEGDYISLPFLDDKYVYFPADPEQMKQVPGMSDRFPVLKTVTDTEGIVILKARTASIKL